MIDIRKLKELVRLMVENDLSELDLKDQQETVTVKRGSAAPIVHHAPVYAHAPAAPAAYGATTGESGLPSDTGESRPPAAGGASEDTSGLVPINSPMVGTVYLAANPESPPFVTAGASIGPDSTVCIIEAMKVFSEIKAEVSGTIERVLIQNGKPVQYGQPMFLVRPS
ncbi:MAG: acetyl-CoA carboxylase biotin carboxyl carrier protein [Phycisphaeraceae bacterium]|nr:acetyl-CoA carboxylase biotin carboxyl carrier protein [Phycisphaeraceae bacterium]MBX3405664.1 acetyl-CoA carboxylase biotin carboxyl carrier protein [Phycisphaeraceae bacterium]